MAQSLPPTHIDAQIGDVSGGSQVAVGSYIVQIGRVEGGVVNILNDAPTPPRSRPQPVSLRPRAFPGLLDRETETANVIQALESKQSVECSGEPGSGKTSLLRSLAYQPQLASFASGVIYFQVNQQTTADLLQSFFDAFYASDFPIKPTETEIRHYLQNVNALILLDDVEIASAQIEALMNIAPNCTFITATAKRSLFGETREVTLKGLPADEAVNLFQRELGRTLSAEELKAAQSICESLGCIPQRVLRAAHETREENRSLAAAAPQAQSMAMAATDQGLADAVIKSRSEDEKKVLTACAVFYGAPVTAEHVAAVADVDVGSVAGVEQMLEDLEKGGLVQAPNNRYALASDLNKATLADLNPWFTRALAHFGDWVDKHQRNPALIAESAEPILLVMRWAVANKFWPEVRRLGHGVEAALALSGKWDMWQSALQDILKAARTEENRAEEAWALHQLGTRALGLGANSEAKASLTDALSLRESLGDQAGAAVTRHNLNILLLPPPPKAQQESGGAGAGAGSSRLPSLLKLGALALVGLALIGVVVWWIWFREPSVVVAEAKILSFTVDPNTVAKGSEAQLCYQLENASSVRIEPGVGETKPTNDCLKVSAEQTTTYTLTAVGSGEKASPITRQITLFVDEPPKARIVRFDVLRENGAGGGDPQFKLCYEVRDANHAELDNNGGEVVLNEPRCQQVNPEQTTTYTLTATGADGRTVSRQATVDATRPPPPPPQVLDFSARPPAILAGEKVQLCWQLKDASSVQIDQSVPPLQAGTDQQCVGVAPVETTVYTLTAFNSEGKMRTRQTTIKVSQPAPQIVSFTAQPSSLNDKGRVRLCYEVRHAERLQIDNGIGEVKPANAGCVDAAVSKTTTFTLTAIGAERQSQQSRTSVAVAEAPIEIEFTVAPDRITPPEAANLCYRVKEASSIRIDPGVGRLRIPAPGEQACVKVQPTKATTYTLTAQGSSNRLETRQIQVYVKEAPLKHARIIFFEVLPTRIKAGGFVRLCYGVADTVRAGIAPIKRTIPLVERECINDAPEKSTTYVLRAMGEDEQTETREASVEVIERVDVPQVRIIRFEVNPTMVHGTQLCYALENARSARIDPDLGELRNLTADCPRIRSLDPKTFTLTATGQDGKTDQRSLRYTPPEQPKETPIRITSFSPANQSIAPGAPAKICYSTFGDGTAQISPQPGRVPPSVLRRCVTVSPKETTTYTLTVTDSKKQTDSRRVTVSVKKPDDVIR